MLNKKLFISLFAVFTIVLHGNIYAHGIGGGDISYKFDKKDNTVDQEVRKKAIEKQEADENWGNFMKEIKKQEEEVNAGKVSDKIKQVR